METTNLLNNLAEIRMKKKELEASEEKILEQLKPVIEVLEKGQKLEVSTGTFVAQKKAVWTFPEALVKEKDLLKEKEEVAKQTGEATYTEITFLKFNVAK